MFENFEHFLRRSIGNLLYYEDDLFDMAIKKVLPKSIERYLYCLSKKNLKHKPKIIFHHADELTSFLYFVSNELWLQVKEPKYAEKIYILNRILNSIDIFYSRNMPDIFHLEHPIGSVIGNATIGNYFVAYQGTTIGGNLDLDIPVIGENVVIYSGAMVIGKCHIGSNCQIGAGVILKNENIENGSTIILAESNRRINSKRDFKNHHFKERMYE